MTKTRKISSLLWALLFAWGSTNAAGLGRLTVQSALGQPLKAEIELLSVTKDDLADITAKLATPEAFRQARIDRQESLGNLRFSVDQRANGQPIIRITSSASVADPFLDMLIELNWSSGRLIREYTILLDPPTAAKSAEAGRPVVGTELSLNGAAKPAVTAAPPVESAAKGKPAVSAAAAATPKVYGPVRSGETLRGIASKLKQNEVSLEQMMVGLYQANKDAFQSKNMNRLNRGAVLNVPEAGAALANTQAEAIRTLRGHTAEWHAYRRQLAEMAGEADTPTVDERAAGKIVPKSDAAPAASAPAKDVLKLSKGEPGGVGKPDAKTKERMQAMEEELAAKGRALLDAQDRVSQLERTVRDMQKLLEMKSQEAAKAPPPAPAVVAPPPEPEVEAPPPAAEPAPVPATVEPAKPAPVIAPLPSVESSSSWISTFISNPIYIGGVLAAVLLSALLWMMMVGSRRRHGLNKFEDSIMTGGEFKNNAVFNASPGNVAAGASTEGSMLLTDFSRLGMGAIDSHEVDPIAEAEVYMAYGRDAQAEEILREALGKDPSRHEIALKLLELYASRKDTNGFETAASELYAGLGGQDTPVWQRAAEMGRTIDPDNPLYRVATQHSAAIATPAAAPAAAAAAIAATAATTVVFAQAPPAAAKADEFDQLESSDDWGEAAIADDNALEFSSSLGKDFVAKPAPITAPAPVDENLMEFESAFAEPTPEPSEPEPTFDLPEPESIISAPAPDATDLDLNPIDDFDLAPELPAAVEATEAHLAKEAEQAEQAEIGLPEIAEDFSLDLAPEVDFDTLAPVAEESIEASPVEMLSGLEGTEELEAAEVGAEALPELDFSGIDLDLDVDHLAELETTAEHAEVEDLVAAPVADFDTLEELEEFADFQPEEEIQPASVAEPEPAAEPEPEEVISSPAEAEAEEGGIDPELHEEVNTKLDLARAYLEMGDREGAREILQEVLGEGDTQQKAEADQLMAEAS